MIIIYLNQCFFIIISNKNRFSENKIQNLKNIVQIFLEIIFKSFVYNQITNYFYSPNKFKTGDKS